MYWLPMWTFPFATEGVANFTAPPGTSRLFAS